MCSGKSSQERILFIVSKKKKKLLSDRNFTPKTTHINKRTQIVHATSQSYISSITSHAYSINKDIPEAHMRLIRTV